MEEQRTCVKFCVKIGKTCTETVDLLRQAFGEQALSQAAVYRWFTRFQAGQESVEDDSRSGRPLCSTTNEKIEQCRQIILKDRRVTVREIAQEVGISYGSAESILKDVLLVSRLGSKFIPKELNCQQKDTRREVAAQNLQAFADDPGLLQRIITGDESWIYGFDAETSAQSSEWRFKNEPRPTRVKRGPSRIKVLLIVFFDIQGVVYHEFLPEGRTVNKEYYREVLSRLREAVRRNRPELWTNQSWVLHHDNAPAHTSLLVSEYLAKNSMAVLPQPPYSPDLAPCDFFLFPKLKSELKGKKFDTREEIAEKSRMRLKAIPKDSFKKCFEEWKNRFELCIKAGGDYFEHHR